MEPELLILRFLSSPLSQTNYVFARHVSAENPGSNKSRVNGRFENWNGIKAL